MIGGVKMNFKKIIIILSIFVILTIIIFVILLVLRNTTKDDNVEFIATPSIKIDPIETQEKLEQVTVRNNYYAVKDCITKFYRYYNSIYNSENIIIKDEEAIASLEYEKQKNIEAIYKILDDDYKKYKGITLNNLLNNLPLSNIKTIKITDMYVAQKDENIGVYFIYGYLLDASLNKSEFSMIVKLDMLNRTFSILLDDYVKENFGNIELGENIEINYSEKIEANEYNTFKYQAISDESYIENVFNDFIESMIYEQEQVYEKLEEEYKRKRFPTFDIFQEYVSSQIKEIAIMELSKYQKTKYDSYTQYVCLTQNNKYYIINEYSLNKYKFILDTYTIDLPEFIKKYEASDEKTKVGLNIQKINQAINEQDFEYVYSKLDDTFKQNNYPNYDYFKEYLKVNLFDTNMFEYKDIEQHGDIYVTTIIINKSKKMNIIMKLAENTNFYISFNIE